MERLTKSKDLRRVIWEGWTAQDFVDALAEEIHLIMLGRSWRMPFVAREEMIQYIVENQPYYKKPIPEVNRYFCDLYKFR